MILVIDVGNTNITFGVYQGESLETSFHVMTQPIHTSDEYGMQIISMLELNGVHKDEIEGVIIASAVPKLMHSLESAIKRYFDKRPLIVGPGIKTGISIVTENPKEIGPDLLVDAVAGYHKYGGPLIIVDFGTATTYIVINEKGEFTSGVICPGIRISAKALWEDTAKLPEVEIRKPRSILAKETIGSMQAGLFYGTVGQTEYIIEQIRKEMGRSDMKVVMTGGLGRLIGEGMKEEVTHDPSLTLDGLRILYEKNADTRRSKA